jgi:hypothetical protein
MCNIPKKSETKPKAAELSWAKPSEASFNCNFHRASKLLHNLLYLLGIYSGKTIGFTSSKPVIILVVGVFASVTYLLLYSLASLIPEIK